MDVGDYTAGELFQMMTERMRIDWQHTSFLAAYLIEVNRSKKTGKRISPDDLNPMEHGGRVKKKGIPLNSPEGMRALQQVSKCRVSH